MIKIFLIVMASVLLYSFVIGCEQEQTKDISEYSHIAITVFSWEDNLSIILSGSHDFNVETDCGKEIIKRDVPAVFTSDNNEINFEKSFFAIEHTNKPGSIQCSYLISIARVVESNEYIKLRLK